MAPSPLNQKTDTSSFIPRWLKTSARWYKARSFSFKFYIAIILASLTTSLILKIPADFVRENISAILVVLTFVILCLIAFALYELVPKPKGLIESLKDAREDQLVDAAMIKLEMDPPRNSRDMARCTQEAMSIIAKQRRFMPWKRLIQVFVRVSSILYLLSVYLRVLVISSGGQRFGLNGNSSYWDFLNASFISVTTFGIGIAQESGFEKPVHKSLFLMFTFMLSILILGMGVNLLASALDESNFINLLYHAVRTYFESITGKKSRIQELPINETTED